MRHVPLLFTVMATAACGARPAARASRGHATAPPPAEFLIAAGDSTFWVTTGHDGVHVRGAPLVLTKYGDRFYEVYVADDDRSFYNAVFVGQRIYARDLLNGDSVAVFEDSTVGRAAAGYAARHPDDAPLDPDEDAAEDPASTVTGEVDILDLHGPFVSFAYHGSANGEAGTGQTSRHGVVDLRARAIAPLRTVVGPSADRVLAAGRQRFRAVRDSIRAIGDSDADDESVRRAARALAGGAFTFDPLSYTLEAPSGALAVAFVVPGHGTGGRGRWLALGPVGVPDTPGLPPWWREVRSTLPSGQSWAHGRVTLVARYDTANNSIRLALRDSAHGDWPVARLPAPAHRVFWLDGVPRDTVTLRALVRAFDESALYSDDARSVRYAHPRHRPIPRLWAASARPPQHRHRPVHRPRRHAPWK